MNTPNKLTVFRVLITPIYLAVYMSGIPHRCLWAAAIFAVAAITDAIDGKLARKNNQVTTFGKFLDPIADKMLTTAALLAFLKFGLCSVWVPFLVIIREFVVASIRMISASQGVVVPANIFGKIKTATQMTFTIIIMLWGELVDDFGFLRLDYPTVSNIMLWITAVLAVISGIIYVADSKKVIDFNK